MCHQALGRFTLKELPSDYVMVHTLVYGIFWYKLKRNDYTFQAVSLKKKVIKWDNGYQTIHPEFIKQLNKQF